MVRKLTIAAALTLTFLSAANGSAGLVDNDLRLKSDRLKIIEDQRLLITDENQYVEDMEHKYGENMNRPEGGELLHQEDLEPKENANTPDKTVDIEPEENANTSEESVDTPSDVEELPVENPDQESGVDETALRGSLKTYYDSLTEAEDVEGDFSSKEEDANMDSIIEKYGTTKEGVERLKADLMEKYGNDHPFDFATSFRFKSQRRRRHSSKKAEASSTKKLLRNYYAKINPDKLKDVDLIVSKVHGNIGHLSSLLKTKYGVGLDEIENVEEHNDSPPSMLEEKAEVEVFSKDEVKNKLLRLYADHEPSKLPYIDALMEMYEGREAELLHSAVTKYTAA